MYMQGLVYMQGPALLYTIHFNTAPLHLTKAGRVL